MGGGWRLELEAALEIRVLHRHRQGIREIARERGGSVTGAALSAARGGGAGCKARPVRAAKLDPFKSYVIARLRARPSPPYPRVARTNQFCCSSAVPPPRSD